MPLLDNPTHPRIEALPQEVIDRIAAGEVVQRPASVVKELIENSLDAHASVIDVQCMTGGMRLLSVTDDGHGIHPQDLELAAKRFATSKLRQLDDLKEIQTFGFRGEALASASMVGRLEIVSRRRCTFDSGTGDVNQTANGQMGISKFTSSNNCAYKMTYRDGEPCGKATPSAGKEGTCVKLQDLFYNVPNRRRAFEGARKESEEYQRILNVVQRYAVDRAREGVGFVCRKKGGNTDLNTSSMACIRNLRQKQEERGCFVGVVGKEKDDEYYRLQDQCTRNIIGHIYGSDTSRELLTWQCQEGDVQEVSLAALKAFQTDHKTSDNGKRNHVVHQGTEITLLQAAKTLEDECLQASHGYDYGAIIAKQSEYESQSDPEPSSQNMKSKGVCHPYSFAYRAYGLVTKGSYCVPKSSSAFLLFINKRLVESASLKRALESVYLDMLPKGAKPFIYLSLELPGPHLDVNVHPTKQEVAFLHEDRLCDALVTALRNLLRSNTTSRTFYTQTLLADQHTAVKTSYNKRSKVELGTESAENERKNDKDDNHDFDNSGKIGSSIPSKDESTEILEKGSSVEQNTIPTKKRKVQDPTYLVRTNRAAEQGALEPFLLHPSEVSSISNTTEKTTQRISNIFSKNSTLDSTKSNVYSMVHTPDCEMSSTSQNVDISIPGAFAFLCRCQVKQTANSSSLQKFDKVTPVVRPKKIVPTDCSYVSIETLRKDIGDRAHEELTTKLRESTFVGCINKRRCLLQSGIELLMVNYYALAKELFYQLSLLRFGGFPMAKLGINGVDVKCLIEQALRFEETSNSSASLSQGNPTEDIDVTEDEVNSELAKQASKCLFDNLAMLEEYFSIKLEVKKSPEIECDEGVLMLLGLPIILDGHSPSPHALPLFLLRLATEVDWSEEQPCFEGICTELGRYYAEIPLSRESSNSADKLDLVDDDQKKFVQHTLFPALRYLLVPPKEFASDGSFVKLALLSKLYKVFERC